jgi:hypothetical protein
MENTLTLYLGKNYQLQVIDEPIEGIEFNLRFRISKTNHPQANVLYKNWYLIRVLKLIESLVTHYAINTRRSVQQV